jgi:CrcB protein
VTGALPWIGVSALGALGALARFTVAERVAAHHTGDFPLGTFAVNLMGAFTLGVLTGASLGPDAMLVLGTGLLGAYTTFSTWMVEAQRLAEDGSWHTMWLYLVGSMLAGILAAGAGWVLAGTIG